jgi:hypothetical protein
MSLAHGATEDINQNSMQVIPEGDDQYNNYVPTFNNLRQAKRNVGGLYFMTNKSTIVKFKYLM